MPIRSTAPTHISLKPMRTCEGVPEDYANLVITLPPYPNNYDYADATRLEMSFMGEIRGWGDLQAAVRDRLVRSCSQHVPERTVDVAEVLADPCLTPIHAEISAVCGELGRVRLTKGGKKTYHLMVACYFLDLARVWRSLAGVHVAVPCVFCRWRFRALRGLCPRDRMVGKTRSRRRIPRVPLRENQGSQYQVEEPKTPRAALRRPPLGGWLGEPEWRNRLPIGSGRLSATCWKGCFSPR